MFIMLVIALFSSICYFPCCSVLPIAMDRAIKEIVTSIVHRSVSIATQTTKELVLKVFRSNPSSNYITPSCFPKYTVSLLS